MGYVNVISSSNRETRLAIASGIREGLERYGLKMLKGHTHPDSTYEAIDAAVVGVARRVTRGTTAREGDLLAMAIDLDGSFGVKGWVSCFDSTLKKSKGEVSEIMDTLIETLESGGVTASRDISAPGILGTLAMLCEASGVGAEIDLGLIPIPRGSALGEWLISYPAMGYIFGIKSKGSLDKLKALGFEVSIVGRFTAKRKIRACLGSEEDTFLDMERESIFGFKRA